MLKDIAEGEGNLTKRLDDKRTDEIGELARAFNQTLERLERLFRTQQRLLADVSHELRSPLARIRVIVSTALLLEA